MEAGDLSLAFPLRGSATGRQRYRRRLAPPEAYLPTAARHAPRHMENPHLPQALRRSLRHPHLRHRAYHPAAGHEALPPPHRRMAPPAHRPRPQSSARSTGTLLLPGHGPHDLLLPKTHAGQPSLQEGRPAAHEHGALGSRPGVLRQDEGANKEQGARDKRTPFPSAILMPLAPCPLPLHLHRQRAARGGGKPTSKDSDSSVPTSTSTTATAPSPTR